MGALLRMAAATPAPSPTAAVNENSVTPGVVGFVAFALVTIAVVLLIVDMTRRIRRVRYRGELAERREAAERRDSGRDAADR